MVVAFDWTLERCAWVVLNSALSLHCGIRGMESMVNGADRAKYSRKIVVDSKNGAAIVLLFLLNLWCMFDTWLFEAMVFPLILIMVCSLFFPYLKSPSPLLTREYDIVDREVSTTRKWHHYLVWSNLVYLFAGVYSISCQQYVFGGSQLVTGICSSLYHLHKESCYFNLDNIFATMCLFSFLYTWICSFEVDMIFFFVGMLGMPVAAFVIIGCGLPADIVTLSAAGENPASTSDNSDPAADRLPATPQLTSPGVRTRARARKEAVGTGSTEAAVKALQAISTGEDTYGDVTSIGSSNVTVQSRLTADGLGDSACCLDLTVVRRNPRPLYDTVHALWHLVSAIGPVQCTWFAHKYVLTGTNSEAALGVLGAGFLGPTRAFPAVPVLSFILSVCVNVFLNYFQFGPFE